MTGPLAPPAAVLRAAARARALNGRPVVVKLGGSAMEEPAATAAALEAVAALHQLHVRLVLVHGGGKPIDRAMEAAGLTPTKVAGRRYTDDATLKIVVETLHEINAELADKLAEFGTWPFAFSGDEPHPIAGDRLVLRDDAGHPIDLGRVGHVTKVDVDELNDIIDNRQELPVIPSLAVDPAGGWLNVNADTVASAIGGALGADAVYFLTDTPGVLRDVREPGSLIGRLTASECRQLIADGVIAGGMIPKAEACFEALAAGAGRAVILDGRDPHALLGEFVSDRASGTEIVP
jgi:acetylglutamate kinase